MNAATIAGLVIALGPAALDLIPALAAIWAKKELTAEEVATLCAPAKKSYDQYIVEARVRMAALSPAHH
jgi:hypothetical protein